jgi:phosphotriesterase-related protein
MGRDVALVRRVAEEVPELNIVVATGIYTYDSVPFYFRHRGPGLAPGAPDPMDKLFVDEITQGIAGSGGVRAGMLKCAIDAEGLTPGVERVMRAVARAHHRTGVPVTVHTHPGSRTAGEVKRVLCDEEQVDPSRIVLGHSGDSTDCDYLAELADEGFVLGMDRFGLHLDVTFEQRAATLAEMCRRGYAGSMVLSQDASCYIDWIDPQALPLLPQWHYLHLGDEVLPYVRPARDHGGGRRRRGDRQVLRPWCSSRRLQAAPGGSCRRVPPPSGPPVHRRTEWSSVRMLATPRRTPGTSRCRQAGSAGAGPRARIA